MRHESLYLADIVDAADTVARFIADSSRQLFMNDELRCSAVLQKLAVIGEAAARLSVDFRKRHADIPWREVIGFRNLAVHVYFEIDWEIVWNTANQDAPAIRQAVAAILRDEYGV